MKLPVFRAFFAGLALFFTHAGELFKALWLPALLMTAASYFLLPSYLDAGAHAATAGQSADPREALAALLPSLKYAGLLYLASAVFYPMMIAGNLKYIIRGRTLQAPFYLQFGLDEARILFTIILLAIMLVLVYATGALALVVLTAIAAMSQNALGGLIALIAMFAFAIALVWFLLRVSMSLPAAIGKKKIGIAVSWRVTAGNAWRLLFYWALWLLVFSFLISIYMALVVPEFLPFIKQMIALAGQDPEAAREIETRMTEMQREILDSARPGFWRYAIGTYVYSVVYAALWNVSGGVAYRYLSGEQPSP